MSLPESILSLDALSSAKQVQQPWTASKEAVDYKLSLEKIAQDKFGGVTSYLEKNLKVHLENVLRQRDEMVFDMIQKKAADVKKCIIEESNETHKVLEDNLEQEKQCQISATNAIIKAFNEAKAPINEAKLAKNKFTPMKYDSFPHIFKTVAFFFKKKKGNMVSFKNVI